MRMSRERLFYLADLVIKALGTTPGVTIKSPDDIRVHRQRGAQDAWLLLPPDARGQP
jgi:hypothetical protein